MIYRQESIHPIAGLLAARYLYIYDNSLSSLENLSALTNLRGLVCKNNALTSLPALSTQTLLEDLDCSNNPITNLPSLSGLSSLRNLYVYNCALQSIPSLTSNTALRILNANNNQLSVLPDLSSNALLVELSVSSNPLTALPSLTNATLLRRLYASYCQLTQVPSLSSNTVLDTLELQYNQLSELPDLSSNTALHKVVVIGNQLSFSDLKPLTLLPLYPGNFKLFPQDTLGVYQEVKVSELNSYTFSTSIDSGFSNVVFTWLKSGAVLYQGAEPTFTLPYAQERNEGRYACEISSGDPVFSNQKILLRPLDLLVETCLETGGNCNPVITPDADGVNDEYFVSETAEVKIYSKNGQLIQEFHSPAGWDGTDKQGKLVPMGVYFIRINEQERISVTVIIQ
ncbi:MAG: leucine-rich repeat domain-containing protein [Cytophagaceae bacterium]|nr:leucine-rich repeat domain-containing protein [Cytophagaceae bacterium]